MESKALTTRYLTEKSDIGEGLELRPDARVLFFPYIWPKVYFDFASQIGYFSCKLLNFLKFFIRINVLHFFLDLLLRLVV